LIIADEQRPGKIMSGVIIATILKDMGYKLRLFMGNVDEASMRSLQILCNMPVTLLDPTLCGDRANLKWLFQQAASPDCLNLVITNLGGRWTEDSPFRIPKECFLLAEWLECEVIPVVYSDTSSTLTVRTLHEIAGQFEQNGDLKIRSYLFRSVLNDREYELVDREAGRQFTSISAGSIPKSLERDAPMITDICTDETNRAMFPIRSAALQLKCINQQVQWPLFSALAKVSPEWTYQRKLCEPITDSGKVNIAVVRHPALTLGGDGTEHMMKVLGCNVVDVPLDGHISHNVPIHGVYIPHGLAYMALPKFFSNIYLKTMFNRASNGSSFLLAEGGSAPILGNKISMTSGQGGGSGRGFGVLGFDSFYKASTFGSPQKLVAFRTRLNPLISGSQECVWGYASASLSLIACDLDEECWETRETLVGKPVGTDGWCKGRILASSMRIEPWSAPESFRRWLEG
jgi:cobyrinic acid a,c-diamide synthase